MPTFAQKIEVLRLRRGWSQRGLARALNEAGVDVTQRAISNWERGAEPRPELATACANLFRLPVDVLLDDTRDLPQADIAGYDREGDFFVAEAKALSQLGTESPARPDTADSNVARLEKGIAELTAQITKMREESAEIGRKLAAFEAFEQALTSGLTIDEVRELVQAAADARRNPAVRAKLDALKARAAAKIAAEDAPKERKHG